jgi:hypothetical protein
MSIEKTQVVEKTLLLDLEKLEKLRKLFKQGITPMMF